MIVVLGHVLVLREDRLGQDGAADERRVAAGAVSEQVCVRMHTRGAARTAACSPACIPAIAQSSAEAMRLQRLQNSTSKGKKSHRANCGGRCGG